LYFTLCKTVSNTNMEDQEAQIVVRFPETGQMQACYDWIDWYVQMLQMRIQDL